MPVTNQQITLLAAIERVATNAKASELDDRFFTTCKEELSYLADSYEITP